MEKRIGDITHLPSLQLKVDRLEKVAPITGSRAIDHIGILNVIHTKKSQREFKGDKESMSISRLLKLRVKQCS